MEQESWMYPGVDPERANVARVYDYLLGGTHNFAVDRDRARTLIAIDPGFRDAARANRAFLGRAVRILAEAGIREVQDLPTLPATIRVWRRAVDGSSDSCAGRVDVIPFESYVKGVVPNEWITSWDQKALEMGQVVPPSPLRDALRRDGWRWVLYEVAALVVVGLSCMGLDRYRRWRRERLAPPTKVD